VLWFPYYDSTYIEKKKVSEEWEATSSDWKVAPNRFEVSSHKGPQAPSLLRFRREIDDCYGYGGGGKGRNTVGDIRICFDVILSEASGGIDGRIQSGAENFAFHLRSASEAGKNVLTRSGVTLASDEKLVIRQGKSYHVNFYNVDATTGLDVDGRELFRKEYAPRANGNEGISDSGVAFGVDDTRAVFTNVKIYRDVYYTEMGAFPGEITLGKDEYFVLGDNSPNSKDGRAWGSLPARNVIGKAFVVFWPPSGIRVIR
jgi:signal peptidase I